MPRFVGGQAAPARLLAEKLTPFGTHSDGEPPLVADCALAVRAQERGDASPEERATPPLLIAFDRLLSTRTALAESTTRAPIYVGVTFVSPPPKKMSVYPTGADLLWSLRTMKLRLGKLLPIQRTDDPTPRYFFPSFTRLSRFARRDGLSRHHHSRHTAPSSRSRTQALRASSGTERKVVTG